MRTIRGMRLFLAMGANHWLMTDSRNTFVDGSAEQIQTVQPAPEPM